MTAPCNRFAPNDCARAFMRTAQYMASMLSTSEVLVEARQMIHSAFAADTVAFIPHGATDGLTAMGVASAVQATIFDMARQVQDSGFMATETTSGQNPMVWIALPVTVRGHRDAVMLVGYGGKTEPPHHLLEALLGVAALVGSTLERQLTDRELRNSLAVVATFAEIRDRRERSHLAAVQRLSRMTGANERAVLDYALTEAMRLLDSRYGFMGTINDDESMMTILAWSQDAMDDGEMKPEPIEFQLSAADVWAEPLRTRAPHFINDFHQLLHRHDDGIPEARIEIYRLLSVPIFNGERIGMIAAVTNKKEAYQDYDASLLSALMTHAWYVVQRNRDEQQLRIAATAMESQEGTVICNADGVILRVNQAFSRITGYTFDETVGRRTNLLKSGRHDQAFYQSMWDSINREGSWSGEIWNRRKNGEIYPEWLSIAAVVGADSKVTHYVGTFSDVTQRKEAEDQIKQLAFFDPLTGLPNRRLLADRLNQALAASARNDREGALLFVDLDNFKTVNDTQGHEIGDLLLQEVARRLGNSFREADTVARLGGDEFVVVLADLSGAPDEAAAQVEIVGQKILSVLGKPYELSGNLFRCTPSIGITLFGNQRGSIDDLMKQADIAMYQAKASGRNTLRFFDPGLQAAIKARANLEDDLRLGIQEDQMLLYYQPQVDGQGRLLGAEALVRWRHPQRGLVSPAEFIPLAEETGLILALGQRVLEAGCAQIVAWAGQPDTSHVTLAVNVSPKQFQQADFVEQVLDALNRTGADPNNLKLELTESLLVENVQDVIEKMSALKAKGVGFSLDDFGTGYSSLSYLKRLPLDQLKIDQTFVRDVLTDPNDATIARTIVALAQSLGLGVIAEGVETSEQRDFLASSGCHVYQGYFFSRPLPLEDFERFAQKNGSIVVSDVVDETAKNVPVDPELLRGTRVLLVDDDPVNRMAVLGLLEAMGIQVDIAVNGAEAVEMVGNGKTDYEVILMDVQMPIMDGLMATRHLRATPQFIDLPIIALTAAVLPREGEECLKAGMSDFIGKPFTPKQLYSAIQMWAIGAGDTGLFDAGTRARYSGETVRLPFGIEGIDIRAGLRRVAGMKKLYLDTLHRFLDDQGTLVERLRQLIGVGDIKTAVRAVHTLKGAASMIEVREISGMAMAVEHMLDGGNVAAGLELIDQLDSKLAALLNALHRALNEVTRQDAELSVQ